MGQGGNLKIINASTYTLQRSYTHSYQMNSWDGNFPETIKPGECPSIYIEWNEGFFNTQTDDSGEAGYSIVGTDRHFEIQARWRDRRDLQVDWQNTIQDPEFFPQPYPSEIVDLGWVHDGTVTLTFCAVPKEDNVEIAHLPVQSYIAKDNPPHVDNTEIKQELANYISVGDETMPFNKVLAMAQEKGADSSESKLGDLLNKAAAQSGTQDGVSATEGTLEAAETNLEAKPLMACASAPSNNLTYLGHWMELYGPVIKNTPLNKLTLVCTHNSGTYSMVSPFGEPWTSCQDLSIFDQLNQGVRVLDLRVGSDDGEFILCHSDWRTNVKLEDALNQVKNFISRNSKEVVVLDFHSFEVIDGEVDENKLQQLVTNTLGSLIYPYPGHTPSLNEMWETQSRVIVSWCNGKSKPDAFFPTIDQKWFDKDNLGDLHSAIEDEMKKNHDNGELWSTCAIITPRLSNPTPIQAITPELSNWFQAGGEWAKEANIIAADFVEKTNIIQQAISECLIKAVSAK